VLDVGARLVPALHHALRGEHHLPELGQLPDGARVVPDVGGGADGAGERERQLARDRPAEQRLRVEALLHQDRIDRLRLLRQLLAHPVHVLVREQVEVAGAELGRHLVERGLLGQDRAEHGLLGVHAVRQVARRAERDGRVGGTPGGILFGHGEADVSSRVGRRHRGCAVDNAGKTRGNPGGSGRGRPVDGVWVERGRHVRGAPQGPASSWVSWGKPAGPAHICPIRDARVPSL